MPGKPQINKKTNTIGDGVNNLNAHGISDETKGGGYDLWRIMTQAPPVATGPTTPSNTNTGGPSSVMSELQRQQQAAAAKAAAAEAAAKKAAKDQSIRENEATKAIVDSLVKSLAGYEKGRDTQIANVRRTLDTALGGILSQYQGAAEDSEKFAARNAQDFDSKSNANILNRVRESTDLMQQVLSQGAGETDSLRALQQATRNFDANQQDVQASFRDTLRSINSNLASAARSAENARLNAWQSSQEGLASAWDAYWKNVADTWTNIQRTEASNTNIDSDYSVGYKPQYQQQAVNEIANVVGKTYQTEKPADGWAAAFGRRPDFEGTPVASNRAAAATVGPLRRAEGATLRKW